MGRLQNNPSIGWVHPKSTKFPVWERSQGFLRTEKLKKQSRGEGRCDASSGKELMDNKRQFVLRAIFKNNLCEESGRDPPFVELGNAILAKKKWR
jgi:hypothetical protein